MTGQLTHVAGLEHIADMHRVAQRTQLLATAREARNGQPGTVQTRRGRVFGLVRRVKPA